MEKFFIMSYLIDIYSPLLTERQSEVLNMFYSENLSISEIAKVKNISRQGVYDMLKRGEKIIYSYDSKLKLFDKYRENLSKIDKIEQILNKEKLNSNELTKLLSDIKENL